MFTFDIHKAAASVVITPIQDAVAIPTIRARLTPAARARQAAARQRCDQRPVQPRDR